MPVSTRAGRKANTPALSIESMRRLSAQLKEAERAVSVHGGERARSHENEMLTDTYGRHHNYLRISLTERCEVDTREFLLQRCGLGFLQRFVQTSTVRSWSLPASSSLSHHPRCGHRRRVHCISCMYSLKCGVSGHFGPTCVDDSPWERIYPSAFLRACAVLHLRHIQPKARRKYGWRWRS